MVKALRPVFVLAFALAAAIVLCVGFLWFRTVRPANRNLAHAKSIAESLTALFPSHHFTGGGGFEEPGIRITVVGPMDKTAQAEICEWIATEKSRQQLATRIDVRFVDEKTGAEVAKSEL